MARRGRWPRSGRCAAGAGFGGKAEAERVVGAAIRAVGPDAVLKILPLNLSNAGPDRPGRAWMLPLLRDNVANTRLGHFREEFVPLSERIYGRSWKTRARTRTMQTKIYETLVQQIWALLPGYCTLPLDLREAFDTQFAELLAKPPVPAAGAADRCLQGAASASRVESRATRAG